MACSPKFSSLLFRFQHNGCDSARVCHMSCNRVSNYFCELPVELKLIVSVLPFTTAPKFNPRHFRPEIAQAVGQRKEQTGKINSAIPVRSFPHANYSRQVLPMRMRLKVLFLAVF